MTREYTLVREGGGGLVVTTHAGPMSEFDLVAEEVAEELRVALGANERQVTLVSSGRVTAGGVEWLDFAYTMRVAGHAWIARARAYSSPERSILVVVSGPDVKEFRQAAEAVLGSFVIPRIEKSRTPGN